MILLLFWIDSASRSGLKRPIEWVGVAVMTLKVGIDIWLSGEGGVVGKEGVALGKGDRAGLSAGLQVLQWKTKCFLIYDLPSYFKVIKILKNEGWIIVKIRQEVVSILNFPARFS